MQRVVTSLLGIYHPAQSALPLATSALLQLQAQCNSLLPYERRPTSTGQEASFASSPSTPLASPQATSSSSQARSGSGPATRSRAQGQVRAAPPPSKTGTIYIISTNNNTICTLVDMQGNPAGWASGGSEGYKNARKATTTAAQAAAEKIAAKSAEKGFADVRIVMRGMGPGKHSAVTALAKSGLRITEIHEATSLPHNGCRAPKKRRG